MQLTIKKHYWIDITILLLTLVVMLQGIGSYGLYEPHEGHFAMVAQEMIWRNDWVTPHLNGAPYLNKPPLLYWLIATTIKLLGSSEFAARLPVALAGWIGIVIAGKWTRDLWGIYPSRLAALMLSVTVGWFIFTHQILIDVLLGTLILSSNYFLWRLLYRPQSNWIWCGAYISLALCILTKGLIGIFIPMMGFLALVVLRQELKILRRIRLYQGLLLILALILPWFIAMEKANPGFWHYFIVNEHLDRFFDRRFPPDYEVSKISALGYLGMTTCWCLPWILFLPSVAKSTWKEWRKGFIANASPLDSKNSDGVFLLAVNAILPVALFLPLTSRLIYYSIPAVPFYVMLCAGWWGKRYQRRFLRQNAVMLVKQSCRSFPDPETIRPRSSTQIINPVLVVKTSSQQRLDIYGLIVLTLGVGFFSLVIFVPSLVMLLPTILQTREISRLMSITSLVLGAGAIASGWGLSKRWSGAWLPIFIALSFTYSATIQGFTLYQGIRSSKDLVNLASACLNNETLWTFEGSRELGAAGAISFYLNQARFNSNGSRNSYRSVKVLTEGGANRLPPSFPGAKPEYLISQTDLQTYWDGDRPVVFLTDFLRQSGDPLDPPHRNLPKDTLTPYLTVGQRQLYLNPAAQETALYKCPS